MNLIDPRAAMKLQPELSSGETIYWAGMPNPSVIFHSDDWTMIPFSFLWGGFAIFWEAGVLRFWGNHSHGNPISWFMALWGVPFIVIGQYMIWGRFLVDAWLKRRTYYAVTNRRVLILQESWKRNSQFSFLESIPEITREGVATGTLWLGTKLPPFGSRGSTTRGFSRFSVGGPVPKLVDIDDVDSVYRLILDLREQARKQPTSST
jgi:hypothetical protein